MISEIPAGLILIGAGLVLPLVPRTARGFVALLAPVAAFAQFCRWIRDTASTRRSSVSRSRSCGWIG